MSHDVLRHLTRDYLTDRDRLSVACVNRFCHDVARVDVVPVLLDDVLGVVLHKDDIFARSKNGYWALSSPSAAPMLGDPPVRSKTEYEWGRLASEKPWGFVREWLVFPRERKTVAFRRLCVESMLVQSWNKDVLVSVRILLSCAHESCPKGCQKVLASTAKALLRQAVWVGQTDVVCFLLDEGNVPVDIDNGTALRLALSTLGLDAPEQEVAELIHELLKRGADPLQHEMWGLRLCLQMDFHIVASLLVVYSMQSYEGYVLLNNLVRELLEEELEADAALVRSSMGFFMFV